MTATCTGPGEHDKPCGRATVAKDYCAGHYAQLRRKRPLTVLRTEAEHPAAIHFKCPATLKQAIERAAAHASLAPAEWLRRAVERELVRESAGRMMDVHSEALRKLR